MDNVVRRKCLDCGTMVTIEITSFAWFDKARGKVVHGFSAITTCPSCGVRVRLRADGKISNAGRHNRFKVAKAA